MYDIKIGWLYPNLMNLHGERGSVKALMKIGENMGLHMQLKRIEDFDNEIPFDDLDIIMVLPGEISRFPEIMDSFRKQKHSLEQYLNHDGYLLAIGTSGLMFGKSILREDGSNMECLGYLDLTAKERKYVWGDDLHFRILGSMEELIGSQIQMADVDAAQPLGKTIYGMGNNNTGTEGARYKNLIYTNCLGPLFVKNPWFAEKILKDICLRKYLGIQSKIPYTLSEQSFESTLKFIQNKPHNS